MVSGLHEADRADALLACTLEHGLHQPATNGSVLYGWIDRDRSHPCNRVPLPKEVAADHTPIPLRDDGVDVGLGQQMADEVGGDVGRREVGWEAVLLGDRLERLVADRTCRFGIVRGSRPKAAPSGLIVSCRTGATWLTCRDSGHRGCPGFIACGVTCARPPSSMGPAGALPVRPGSQPPPSNPGSPRPCSR